MALLDCLFESLTERTFSHREPPLALKAELYTIEKGMVKYTFINSAAISHRIQNG
jgi:hypothetical protein